MTNSSAQQLEKTLAQSEAAIEASLVKLEAAAETVKSAEKLRPLYQSTLEKLREKYRIMLAILEANRKSGDQTIIKQNKQALAAQFHTEALQIALAVDAKIGQPSFKPIELEKFDYGRSE